MKAAALIERRPETIRTKTYCQICEQACPLIVTATTDRIVDIAPNRAAPHWRDFCIKGASAGRVRDHPDRVLTPFRRIDGRLVASSYEAALDDIAQRLIRLGQDFGTQALASYTGNPNGFSISNSAFHNAFMAAFGSSNRFWVGSIDQNAMHYVAKAIYGSAWCTLLPDIDHCQCLLLIGANPAISAMSWMGAVPEGWRRVLARPEGAELIVLDPRHSETAQKATLHIASLPETDWAFLIAVIATIERRFGFAPAAYEQAVGLERIVPILRDIDMAGMAAYCDVPVTAIEDVAERFHAAKTAACLARTGSAMGRYGALTEWLSHLLNLVTGRIDVRGGRCYNDVPIDLVSVAEQVFPDHERPSRVRGTKPIAGAYALAELPDEILTPGPGQVRGLIVNGGNPVISGPDGVRLAKALAELDLLVGIDLFVRDSHASADWIIPGSHFLERDEFNPLSMALSTDPWVQAGRAALPLPNSIWPEWRFYKALAERMGLDLFAGLPDPSPPRLIDGLLHGAGFGYDEVWNAPNGLGFLPLRPGKLSGALRTPSGKIEATPAPLLEALQQALATLQQPIQEKQYRLISRRRMAAMNSWLNNSIGHEMRDLRHDSIEISKADAARDTLVDGDVVTVSNMTGALCAKVIVSDSLRCGVAVMEHGWEASLGGVNRNELVSAIDLDPLTSVPRFNGTGVTIEKGHERLHRYTER
ncbi:MAG: molybdopterin-dependent oxidoreductase [Sphingomonadaceae bacterium]|nr:molybdopterin-dependent oxidoreductase [Sphingomonadaceae bacterium]